jgi:hypothetical protein
MIAKVFASLSLASGLGLMSSAAQNIPAQAAPNPVSSTTVVSTGLPNAPAQLPEGVEEISELAQGGVNSETLQSFIQSSHLDYELDTAGIAYLRQQGVSDAVISAMMKKTRDTFNEAQAAPRRNWPTARWAYDRRASSYAMPHGIRGFPVYTEEPMPYDYYDHYYNDAANVYYFPYPAGHPAANRRPEWENGLYRRWLGHQYFIGNPGFRGGVFGGGGARR